MTSISTVGTLVRAVAMALSRWFAGTRAEAPLVLSPEKIEPGTVSACHRFLAVLSEIPVSTIRGKVTRAHAAQVRGSIPPQPRPWGTG